LLAQRRRTMGEKEAQGGEHRTEVTEVTEGGTNLGVKLLAGMRWPAGEKQVQGERASHRGHRGGNGGWGRSC
jgi:hypothetical protein